MDRLSQMAMKDLEGAHRKTQVRSCLAELYEIPEPDWILELKGLGQMDLHHKVMVSLGDIVRPCPRKQNNNKF